MEKDKILRKMGDRLKILRNVLGMTQKEFGALFERSQQDVHLWESGKFQIPMVVLIELKRRYGISWDYFAPNEENYIRYLAAIEETGKALKG